MEKGGAHRRAMRKGAFDLNDMREQLEQMQIWAGSGGLMACCRASPR